VKLVVAAGDHLENALLATEVREKFLRNSLGFHERPVSNRLLVHCQEGNMLRPIAAACALNLAIQLSAAQSAHLDPQQMTLIRDTAASICNTVKEIKGEKTQAQIQGEVKGQLSGLLGKLSGAEASVSGTGTLSREAFEGLTQDATAISLAGDRDCRMKLFDRMFDQITSTSSGTTGPVIQQTNGTNSPAQNGTGNTVIINGKP
jgi:hypothetical protein